MVPLVSSGGSFQIKNIYDSPSSSDPSHPFQTRPEYSQPEFVLADSGNVTAILGKTATLNCRVRAVGNRTVRQSLTNYEILVGHPMTYFYDMV